MTIVLQFSITSKMAVISYFDVSAMVDESIVIPEIPEGKEGSTSDSQSGRKGTRTPGPPSFTVGKK